MAQSFGQVGHVSIKLFGYAHRDPATGKKDGHIMPHLL
jgi:hypothetical protein